LRIRLDLAEFWDVREFVREKEKEEGSLWFLLPDEKPLSDSQIRRYLLAADKLIAESCRASRRTLTRRHLARRRNIAAKALSAGDYRAALAALDSEAKLQGLFPSADGPLLDELRRLRERQDAIDARDDATGGIAGPREPGGGAAADAPGPAPG
jgi:hypothetical protein